MIEARYRELGSPDRRYRSNRGPNGFPSQPTTLENAQKIVKERNDYYERVGRKWIIEVREVTEWIEQ